MALEGTAARRRARLSFVAGLVALGGVLLADAAGKGTVLTSLAVIAPLACALAGTVAETAMLGTLALLATALAFIWDHDFAARSYWIAVGVVLCGSAFAVLLARARANLRADAARLRLLAAVGRVWQRSGDEGQAARAIAELLVPAVFDFCLIDVICVDGTLRRLAGAFGGEPELLERFLARPPTAPGRELLAARSLAPGAVQRLTMIDDDLLQRVAYDDDDLRLLRSLALRSALVMPLTAGDEPFGVLALANRGARPSLGDEWVQFAETLAGGVVLALGNARLTGDLGAAERELHARGPVAPTRRRITDTSGEMPEPAPLGD